jgi:hypothetical protein
MFKPVVVSVPASVLCRALTVCAPGCRSPDNANSARIALSAESSSLRCAECPTVTPSTCRSHVPVAAAEADAVSEAEIYSGDAVFVVVIVNDDPATSANVPLVVVSDATSTSLLTILVRPSTDFNTIAVTFVSRVRNVPADVAW